MSRHDPRARRRRHHHRGRGSRPGVGGGGSDYLDGQGGDDVLTGGILEDVVHGLDGNDAIDGRQGQDHVEGGAGNDLVSGGAGNDVVSGGNGDDTLRGAQGADVLYGGRGVDTVVGGLDIDCAYVEAADAADAADTEGVIRVEIAPTTDRITISGSADFVARTQADLDMLAGSPRGQALLNALGTHIDGEDTLTIVEESGRSTITTESRGHHTIHYDPTVHSSNPAALVLPIDTVMHEGAHAFDFMTDTADGATYVGDDPVDSGRIRQLERQATGLPIDHDHDADKNKDGVLDPDRTPEVIDPDHPIELTGNGLREEMGLAPRPHHEVGPA